jgi:hypothetical protein
VKLLVVLLFAIPGLLAGPITVFSDLGSPPHYDRFAWYGILGSGEPAYNYLAIATPFKPIADVTLTQIDLGLAGDDVIITLSSDNAGVPGTILASWLAGSSCETCYSLQTLVPTSSIYLDAGKQYWITDSPLSSTTCAGWFLNAIGATGEFMHTGYEGAGDWSYRMTGTLAAFDVLGNPIPRPPPLGDAPEPLTAPLVGGGLLALVLLRRHCRF